MQESKTLRIQLNPDSHAQSRRCLYNNQEGSSLIVNMKLTSLFILLVGFSAFSQNPVWTHIDKRTVKKIARIDREDPKAFERFFIKKKCIRNVVDLGFGWNMWTPTIGGGYISYNAEFYYYNDRIVSYTIAPELPGEERLINKYKNWCRDYFDNPNGTFGPITLNPELLFQPLKEYHGNLIPDSLNPSVPLYMSTASGNIYGFRGGYGNNLLYNRKLFMAISDSLQFEELEMIMYAINPVSRFMAIEHYLRHQDSYPHSDSLDAWIEACFEEVPKIKSMDGCFIRVEDSKCRVFMYSQLKAP